MRRGFKALTERNAVAARQALGLEPLARLDAFQYAKHLNVHVTEPKALGLSQASLHQLLVEDSDSWSALTLQDQGVSMIVINSAHADTRQQADVMHELAHIELGHAAARVDVSKSGVLLLSEYSDEQEQEADWHAAAFLVPRDGILQMRSRQASTSEIASYYGVSEALCEWRIRMTGVDVQMRRRSR
ncbi:MAG: ImmA/IrrE family metallo-endopeptidase [Pseudomonadota bacterium]|nr:ImmA/IrrE family metallo-endopeptidase [Pseudomonadota bacterium]